MKAYKALLMAAKSNAAWRRNSGDRFVVKVLSWFWFCFYVFRAIRFGLLFTGREQLGSRVLYKGKPATVSNWAGQPCVSLCVGDQYVRHAMRDDIQQQVNLRELLHRFRSGVSFYTTNWMQIDINRRIYPVPSGLRASGSDVGREK